DVSSRREGAGPLQGIDGRASLLAEGHGMSAAPQDVAGRLGENVRQLRLLRSMTQEQISRLAGLPRATWANLESGTANPTLAVLQRVAEALQVRLEELIEPPRRQGRLDKGR